MPERASQVADQCSLRIALFLPTLFAGGVERMMLNLAGGFLAKSYRVDLVVANASGPFCEQIPAQARLIDLKSKRVLFSVSALTGYLRAERPDTLIAGMTHSTIAALCARKLAAAETKIIATEHIYMSLMSRDSRRLRVRAMPLLARWFLPRVNHIVAVSHGVAEDVSRCASVPRERIHVIYNPVITPEIFWKAQESSSHPWMTGALPVILSAGQLTVAKAHSDLLRAFALLVREHPARLLILGEGPLRHDLEELVLQLGIAEHVSMPGFEPNPYAYMARAKVFALPSRYEGFGMVLVEALALGASIVSTDCPSGPREILEGGRWGRLVPVGDVDALAKALIASLDAPHQPVPPEALNKYELQAVVSQYEELMGLGETTAAIHNAL